MLERGKLDRGIVEIVDTESLVPKTYFEVSNNDLKWTMYLNIQSEKYVEYELDIHLD